MTLKSTVMTCYREYLDMTCNSKKTADQYAWAVRSLLSEIEFDTLDEIPVSYLERKLKELKTKNIFSAAKNGLKKLKSFDSRLELPTDKFFEQLGKTKKNHRHKPKPIHLSRTRRTVNQMSNKKMKLAYRLMMISGLRVSEVARLRSCDLEFLHNNKIMIRVLGGKGGKDGIVQCMEDTYTYRELKNFIADLPRDGRIFYSAQYMIDTASKLKLQCHDFRRIYAITHRNKLRKVMKVRDANSFIQHNLRHTDYSTTKTYLYHKKLIQ